MNETQEIKAALRITADVLCWCTAMGFVILIFWFGFFVFGADFIYRIHSSLFQITREQFDVMMYFGMMFWKLFVILFFLIPYLAILIALRKQPR